MKKKEFTIDTFYRMLDKVVEWNEIGGNCPDDTSLIPVYTQLAREEMFGQNEFLQGYFTGDKVMMADGTADSIFTGGFLSVLTQTDTLITDEYECKNEYRTFAEAVSAYSSNLILEGDIGESLFAMCLYASEHFDVESVFNRVAESNFSKYLKIGFPETTGLDFLESQVNSIESEGRYGDVHFKEVNGYIVFLAGKDLQSGVVFDSPKIVKPTSYKSPEDLGGLEEFIY